MKKFSKMILFLTVICMLGSSVTLVGFSTEITDDSVLAVIDSLEAIDTLQEIQNKRSQYTASGHYDITTTNESVIAKHDAARTGYESYVDTMFAARIAAQNSYHALSAEQKAQIDPTLVAKLNNDLPTVFNQKTFSVTPGDNEYTFETVNGGLGYAYEVSNHMVSRNIPQTFILVDTSDGKTSWTPNGLYEYGKSNYNVAYCCDVQTGLEYATHYKRLNLEDCNYYSKESAQHIRAIVMNAYPFVTVEEMKSKLKAEGMDSEFVDSLTRADMIAAVQQAIWTYANSGESWDNVGYFASIDVTRNTGIYFTPLHDYTNECWDWLPGKRTRSYDFEAAYRVNNLVYYLCNLDGVSAADGEIIISDIDITRANLIAESEDTYEVGMYVHLNTGAGAKDNMIITVTSYGNDNSITDQVALPVDEATTYEFGISAVCGDRITVSVEGTQYLEKGAYFYEPEGGRDHSQCLVGVGGGKTRVKANESFIFNSDIEMGIRIYKTAADTGLPLSDITFDIYNVILNEGETVGKIPTEEDIAKYATDEYKVGSITTDVTGYASLALDRGMYLVVEQHNEHKIKAPMAPFFISVPMPSESKDPSDDANTDVAIDPQDIVSIYPKNEPVEPPEDPPEIPYPPDNVKGRFSISKHDAYDEFKKLSGASFQVFRMATAEDTDVQIVRCDGIEYAVVPLTVDGENLILTTDENGSAVSPQLTCGTYFLVETATPKGYIPLDEAVLVTVKSQLISDAEVLNIANYPGEILPGTGGAGIAWMIWIGSAIAIITAILLITEKKMKNYNSAE